MSDDLVKAREAIEALQQELRRERRRATDAEYMKHAYRQMLGPKGRTVAQAWEDQGCVRVHTSWGPGAADLDGEGIAEAHLRFNEAVKDSVLIDDVDGHIEQANVKDWVASLPTDDSNAQKGTS